MTLQESDEIEAEMKLLYQSCPPSTLYELVRDARRYRYIIRKIALDQQLMDEHPHEKLPPLWKGNKTRRQK